jgi:hypothetical protein
MIPGPTTQGNTMYPDSFQLECDRISQGVDDVQFERLRWSKTEGPMLARLVELAQAAISDRDDFELVEEGASSDIKRFVLKVHSNRVVAIALWLESGHGFANVEEIGRSRYRIIAGAPVSADFALVDETWMSATLQELLTRIIF